MINRWFNVPRLWKDSQNRFLVVEEIDSNFKVTEAKVNPKDKKVSLLKNFSADSWNGIRSPLFSFDNVILALNHGRATTIESVITLKRSQPKSAIDDSELDHLIFRALWEFLNRYRTWSAKKMSVTDLDLTLASAEISEVRLDSHRVFNPLGFSGRDFIVRLRGTFVSRETIPLMRRASGWGKNLVVVENISTIASWFPPENRVIINCGHKQTVVFTKEAEEQIYLESNPWGAINLFSAIGESFLVDNETVTVILKRYAENSLSSRLERFIDRKLSEEMDKFFEAINFGHLKIKKPNARFALNFNVDFQTDFLRELINEPRIDFIDFHNYLEHQGFNLEKNDDACRKNHSSTLALLTYPHFDSHYGFMNQLLKRRAKWLIPNI